MSANEHFVDAYSPAEIAQRVEQVGVAKARMGTLKLLLLAMLAGAFISLGGHFYIVVSLGSELGYGITRLLAGMSFCLGLVLVVVAGAELFTGNNLIAMAWASGLIRSRELLRSWILAYIGNVIGCLGTVFLLFLTGLGQGQFRMKLIEIAQAKASLTAMEAFSRGILCNALVCLAVWLCMGGRSVTDKILAILFPITAFVAIGLEHSIANWFFLPFSILVDSHGTISFEGVVQNLFWVTTGNIIGGSLLVAGVYWAAYLREKN